jgi:hypothetical protein
MKILIDNNNLQDFDNIRQLLIRNHKNKYFDMYLLYETGVFYNLGSLCDILRESIDENNCF